MSTETKTVITVEALVNAPVDKVWKSWNTPEDITQWNAASDDWTCPSASVDLRPGGKLIARMESRDGSMGFDFEGIYDEVRLHDLIAYTLGDGRKVRVIFEPHGQTTSVTEYFEAENMHSHEMQKAGWQAILDRFKSYTERL